ncbi:acyl-CoA dehydrogenase domain-containing protein [Ephemerocybe angulata]|uniref:Acyl-CoA dehydrogenase domain-containing protein n=1 Tax=Ephemerocybe angulata TaxID=980116 RepID=A0A8H6MHY5_9AGAR|nr:acyl-CoA dehydrogenase domain-containing protein [Tulosesus angulatus]
MRIEQGFQPTPFPERNVYLNDPVLPSLLRRVLPADVYSTVVPDLERLGNDVINEFRPLASSPLVTRPTVLQYDQWGRRIDALHTSEGWRRLKAMAQQEGLPAIFYERLYGEHSRTYGFAKILLLVGDTQEVFCPLSMTDGAARILELSGNNATKDIYERLTSRDPSSAFTAGQWMTERPGGSDVSLTETTATPLGESHPYGEVYSLNGVKWFSSATDSEVSIALGRTGPENAGARGLSLFLVPLRLPLFPEPSAPTPSPISNNIFLHRLKDKIGTHALPTAELSLEGTRGYLISPLNKGVKSITPVLNITRVWSAVTSTGHLRKCLEVATSYAGVRRVKSGQELLADNVVHVERLAKVNLLYRALVHMVFGVVQLMGKVENNPGGEDEGRRLRMLTPVVKAFAAEKATGGMEEAMTALGGAGYMEENGIGRAIRDGLVEKIWEGTVVVLALDLTRAAQDPVVLRSYTQWAESVLASCPGDLRKVLSSVNPTLEQGVCIVRQIYTEPMNQIVQRPALILLGYLTSSLYLLEHASWSWARYPEPKNLDVEVLRRWVLEEGFQTSLDDVERARKSGTDKIEMDTALVFGRDTYAREAKL